MKRFHKIILVIVLTTLSVGMFSSCGKKDSEKQDSEKAGQERMVSEGTREEQKELPDGNSLSVKKYKHGTMSIEMEIPEVSVITESEDGVTAETQKYLLSVFGMDQYKGALLYDIMDIVSIVDSQEQRETAKDILRLKNYTIPENAEGKLYNSINGVEGFWCPLSGIEYESANGRKTSGDGFLMVYEKAKGLGVYLVLGIQKNGGAEKETSEMLKTCAMSLNQDYVNIGEYVEWTGSMPDGVNAKALFKKDVVIGQEEDDRGLCLYYDEENEGYYLIQHFSIVGNATSEEYIWSIIDSLKNNEGVSFSGVEEAEGKMTYQKVTMTYARENQEVQEIVCVSVDERENVWLVDLYGTVEQVKSQEENLAVLLGSLQED